jgi:indole-3-glycerol phosphate synthase
MSDTILDRIIRGKREEVQRLLQQQDIAALREAAEKAPPTRGFKQALDAGANAGRMAIIAEIKRASPSKGLIREDFDPAALARAYEQGGAACLSVLTDAEYFQGSAEYLTAARQACALPVLRKDFMIDPAQIYESRAMGADCILLIAAALDQPAMGELADLALALGLDVLVEVHDADELTRALALDGRCILGINNRNLKTFETSLDVTLALREHIPADRFVVSESGIASSADLARLRPAKVSACLVGESLMRQPDVADALRRLLA